MRNLKKVDKYLHKFDVVVSTVPYHLNFTLAKLYLQNNCTFIDLSGNNNIVKKMNSHSLKKSKSKKN